MINPKYACAILETADGRLLLEERPIDLRRGVQRMTCFGGGRERFETPEQCVRRELLEELGWSPSVVELKVELWVKGAPIAWFYHAPLDVPLETLRFEPGYNGRLAAFEELPLLPISPWHAAVLTAWRSGVSRVDLSR